jgi:hypothetical protein
VNVLAIILIALAAVLIVLFLGGLAANARRRRALEADLRERIAAANQALADARAQDRGWDPALLEAAALAAFAARHPGATSPDLHLVQVIDRPGTEADEAIYEVLGGDQRATVRLGRQDGVWGELPASQ